MNVPFTLNYLFYLRHSWGFVSKFSEQFGLDESVSHVEIIPKLKEEIDSLAIVRNQIAHGVEQNEFLKYDMIVNKISTFSNIISSMIETCERELFLHNIGIEYRSTKTLNIKTPKKIFQRLNVVGFLLHENFELVLSANVQVYLVVGGQVSDKCKIERMFVDGKPAESIDLTRISGFTISTNYIGNINDLLKFEFHIALL